jgi:hypothetical protein
MGEGDWEKVTRKRQPCHIKYTQGSTEMLDNCKQLRLFVVPKELVFAGMLLQPPPEIKLIIPGDFDQFNKQLDKGVGRTQKT